MSAPVLVWQHAARARETFIVSRKLLKDHTAFRDLSTHGYPCMDKGPQGSQKNTEFARPYVSQALRACALQETLKRPATP